MPAKPRIAYLAGPNATINNSPPLVTSNKARLKYGLPLIVNPDKSPARYDVLRPQRLACRAVVYVEQLSAHPLERDAAELYGPPDGYINARGQFHRERQGAHDKPVEGLSPYGTALSVARHKLFLRAVHSGMPVVRVGRGNNEGFTAPVDRFLGGRNLTATKARLLLMACLMRFGSLPPVADPGAPTDAELAAIREKLAAYQAVFDTH